MEKHIAEARSKHYYINTGPGLKYVKLSTAEKRWKKNPALLYLPDQRLAGTREQISKYLPSIDIDNVKVYNKDNYTLSKEYAEELAEIPEKKIIQRKRSPMGIPTVHFTVNDLTTLAALLPNATQEVRSMIKKQKGLKVKRAAKKPKPLLEPIKTKPIAKKQAKKAATRAAVATDGKAAKKAAVATGEKAAKKADVAEKAAKKAAVTLEKPKPPTVVVEPSPPGKGKKRLPLKPPSPSAVKQKTPTPPKPKTPTPPKPKTPTPKPKTPTPPRPKTPERKMIVIPPIPGKLFTKFQPLKEFPELKRAAQPTRAVEDIRELLKK